MKRIKRQMSDAKLVMIFITLSGGFQDAYSYLVRGKVFANAQTGNIVLLGHNLFSGNFGTAVNYLVPLTFFALGVLISEQIRGRFKQLTLFHWRQITVSIEIIMLLIVGFLPVGDIFNPIANGLTSCACAIQIEAFKTVMGLNYASTMCIGNLKSCMSAFSSYLRTKEKKYAHNARLYFFVILTFFIGSSFGSVMCGIFSQQSIWFSCALLAVAVFLMFFKRDKSADVSDADSPA